MKEKNIFLNKKIKSLEESKNLNITNSIDNKSESFSFINNNQNIFENGKNKKRKIFVKNIKKNHYINSSVDNNINHKKFIKIKADTFIDAIIFIRTLLNYICIIFELIIING